MIYRYDKKMRRISRILDSIHAAGYPDNEFSVAADDNRNKIDVMIGSANDLIRTVLSKYKLPHGWKAEEKEGTYYAFSCAGTYCEIADMLDSLYYWFEKYLPEYKKDKGR